MAAQGRIVWVSGPAVRADGMSDAKMYETVTVGDSKLVGEVIRLTRRCSIYSSIRINKWIKAR